MRIHTISEKLLNRLMPTIDEIRRVNLALLISEAGGNKAFADQMGVSESQLSQWANGSSNSATGRPRGMRTETAQKIERSACRPLGWLDKDHQPISNPLHESSPQKLVAGGETMQWPRSIRVPLMSAAASMGEGAEQALEDVVVGSLELSPQWVSQHLRSSKPDQLRFLSAYGDSMAPTFSSGDVLLVDTGARSTAIDGIYVISAQQRLFVKRVRQRMDGTIEISSDNPAVKTTDVLNGDHQVDVLGRVVWVWNGKKV